MSDEMTDCVCVGAVVLSPYGCGPMHKSMLVHGVQYVRDITVNVECCAECALYLKLFELV